MFLCGIRKTPILHSKYLEPFKDYYIFHLSLNSKDRIFHFIIPFCVKDDIHCNAFN